MIIKPLPPSQMQIESYPGAKILNVLKLIQNYPDHLAKLKAIIISIGLIDHENNVNTNTQDFRKIISQTKCKFPDAKFDFSFDQLQLTRKPTIPGGHG